MYSIRVDFVDEQKSRARFSLPGRLEWRAEHITALINALAEIRAEMTPQVPETAPGPYEVAALHDPRYVTQLHELSGGTVFEFRHPSLGWLEFVVPSNERVRISSFLAEQETLWQGLRRP
jgi:hypothetical protein